MKPGIYRNWTNTAIHFAAYIGMLLLAMALCSGASLSPVTLSPPSGGTSHEAPILPSLGSPPGRWAVR